MTAEERDLQLKLARSLLGEFVRFNHDRPTHPGYPVTAVTEDGMVEIQGLAGQFAPHLFVRVERTFSGPEQAKQAIEHVLTRIRDDSRVAYYFCEFTESFELVTEAFATLTGQPVQAVREKFRPRNPSKP